MLALVLLCSGLLLSCSDDDDDNGVVIANTQTSANPEYGFIVNSLAYTVVLDFNEREEFTTTLTPGMIIEMNFQEKKTHLLHVMVMNDAGRIFAEYVNSFYIDDVPLDNQLGDFQCSWYIELISEYGFDNNFGT